MSQVKIVYNDRKILLLQGVDSCMIASALAKMLDILRINGMSIENVWLFFINDSESAEINKKYMACSGPANVLSFEENGGSPGQIYISADTLEREAFIYGMRLREYFLRLLAHGLCHAGGLEHGEEMEYLSTLCLEGIA